MSIFSWVFIKFTMRLINPNKKDKNIFEDCDKDEARDVRKQSKSDFLKLDDIFDEQNIVPPEIGIDFLLIFERKKLLTKTSETKWKLKKIRFYIKRVFRKILISPQSLNFHKISIPVA